LAEVEAADLAEQLIGETCRRQGIQRDQFTCMLTEALR
jgi:hypothetical protein